MNYAGKWCDAQQKGHVTIERLEGGKTLFNARLFDSLDAGAAFEIWSEVSRKYAQAASGAVICFIRRQDDNGVFQNIELPELLKNERIDFINGIPREELKSIYDQDRSEGKKESLSHIHSEIAKEEPKHLEARTREDYQEKRRELATDQVMEQEKTETLRAKFINGRGQQCFLEVTGIREGEDLRGLRLSNEHDQIIDKLQENGTLTLSIDAIYQSIGREQMKKEYRQEQEQQRGGQERLQQEQRSELTYSR